jgi:hypothetical protein
MSLYLYISVAVRTHFGSSSLFILFKTLNNFLLYCVFIPLLNKCLIPFCVFNVSYILHNIQTSSKYNFQCMYSIFVPFKPNLISIQKCGNSPHGKKYYTWATCYQSIYIYRERGDIRLYIEWDIHIYILYILLKTTILHLSLFFLLRFLVVLLCRSRHTALWSRLKLSNGSAKEFHTQYLYSCHSSKTRH